MRKFCLLIIILWGGKSFAQVNLPTGSATFSLPMFKWQDNKSRLNAIIDLEYNSGSGLRVNDVASNIGQGWSMIAGGVITRIQVGEPDDQHRRDGNGTSEDVTKYPDGFLYDPSPTPGCSNALVKYPIYKDKNHVYKQHNEVAVDKEIDHFAFQFNGRSGVFVIGRNTAGSIGPVTLGDTKLKIWFDKDETMINQGIRTTITAFYIQDENGLIYKFATHDLAKVLKTKYCNANLSVRQTQPSLKSGKVAYESMFDDSTEVVNPYIITGWYLSLITDPLTNDSIKFTYNTHKINTEAGTSISYYSEGNYSIVSHSISISQTPRIASIVFPDGHQALFHYGNERVDMKGDSVLSSVDVMYQNRYLSKYVFNESYFIRNRFGIPVTDDEKKSARLCLRSVKKLGPDLKAQDNPYQFDYYVGSSTPGDFVPPPFFHLKDIWGYYNGDQSKEANNTPININSSPYKLSNVQLKGLCFLHDGVSGITLNPKDGYAKNGLLHQITFPTGSSLNYDYEQNKAIVNGQNILVGGVHVSKTTVTDGGYSNDCNNPVVTNYNYTDSTHTYPSLWGVEMPVNSIVLSNHYSPEEKHFKLLSLSCKYKYQYPGILSRDGSVPLTTMQQVLQVLSTVAGVVGTVSEVIDIIKFVATGTGPAAVIIDAITTVLNVVVTCFLNPSRDNSITIYYNSDLNASNPLPAQFSRVEVTKNNGSDGKTVYEFTSPTDYAIWEPYNKVYSMKQRYAYWAYGLPKKTTFFDNAGNYVRQIENSYDYEFAKSTYYCKSCTTDYLSYKSLVLKTSSQNNVAWDATTSTSFTTDMTTNPAMEVEGYDAYTGRALLTKTIQRDYKNGDKNQYMQTTTEFEYNNGDDVPNINYEVNKITTILPNGDTTYKFIKYDGDYLGVFLNLTSNHIVNLPIESATAFRKKGSTQLFYTGESVTEYTNEANGNLVPSRTLVQRFSAPVPESSMSFYEYPGSSTNPPYKETQTFIYDAHNNLDGLKDEGNHIVTNIYDYNDKYVVASVINADPALDKPAYTSFETTDFTRSGWTMTGAAVYSSSSITGSSSLTLVSGKSLSATLNSGKAYIVSFWASNSGITVTGNATLVKSAPTLNGFTYYEYNIAAGTSTVTISGSANIDELRLYPQNARMRTVTYDPLIGKTSECDENNRITYYEYDELGRLRYIKDESKNIVKMYEYNLKSKNTSCGTTYHNLMVSEVFTRNNCGTGTIGTDTTYIIPDSKYTSTVSQEDVDQQVQADLNAFGQNFANTYGSCKTVYGNAQLTQTFTKEGCDVGYKGTSATYTVPANKYTSTISPDDANAQAQEDMDANAQSFVNLPGNSACVVDTAPDFDGSETAPTQCQVINGTNTGHRLIQVTDINPNSSTYNQTQWADEGVDASCPASSCYYSAASGFSIVAGSIAYTGSQVTFYIVFKSNTSAYWSNTNQIATIMGGCTPSSDRTLSMSENGRTWQVIISHLGVITVRLVSGTPPSGTSTIGLTGGAFNL